MTVRFVNSLVGVITSEIDSIHGTDMHPSSSASPGLVDGVHSPEMIVRHFRNTLVYIQCTSAPFLPSISLEPTFPSLFPSFAARKAAHAAQEHVNSPTEDGEESTPKPVVSWDTVDIVGAVLKMGLQ